MKPRVEKSTEARAARSRTSYGARGTSPVKEKGELSPTEAAAVGTGNGPRPAATARPPSASIRREDIAARAYAIWEREGKPQGCEIEHWLRAEAELRMEKGFAS